MPPIPKGQSSMVDHIRGVISSRRIWWGGTWFIYLAARLITITFGIAVPFGLSAIIYYPEILKYKYFNIIILTFSFVSLLGQILIDVFKVRDRSLSLRGIYQDLSVALARYEDNIITIGELNSVLDRVGVSYLTQSVP